MMLIESKVRKFKISFYKRFKTLKDPVTNITLMMQ